MRFLAGPMRVLLLFSVAALLASCGSAPEQIGPGGVDEVSRSIATPDPDDFVTGVDNKWLPLVPGRTHTYEVLDDPRSQSSARTVLDQTREVAGVATTVVRTVFLGSRGKERSATEEFYAQDRQGNVWLFGQAGARTWQVGQTDNRAVLAMSARPRHGDGYATEYIDGQITRTATVLETDASNVTPYATYDDVVLIESTPEAGTPTEETASISAYARGTGLVARGSDGGLGLYLVGRTG